MATRFHFPATGSPAVTPPTPTGWIAPGRTSSPHDTWNQKQLPLSYPQGSTTLTTSAVTPDNTDHTVNGDCLFAQFVSDVLSPQTFSAQTVRGQLQGLEANAGNNLFISFKVLVVSEDGTSILATIVSLTRTSASEFGTSIANRSFSATSSAYTATGNCRLVVEVGAGGTPVATSGTQGHNFSLRLGESGASGDLPVDNTTTGTGYNGWIEFVDGITPPAMNWQDAAAGAGAGSAKCNSLVVDSNGIATLLSGTPDWDNSDSGCSGRNVLDIGPGLGQIRVTFDSPPSNAMTVDHASLGISTGSGGDVVETPTEITFDGGGHGFSIAVNQTKVSDWISFDLAAGEKLVVDSDYSGSGGHHDITTYGSGIATHYLDQTSNTRYLSLTFTESVTNANSVYGISKIETRAGPATTQWEDAAAGAGEGGATAFALGPPVAWEDAAAGAGAGNAVVRLLSPGTPAIIQHVASAANTPGTGNSVNHVKFKPPNPQGARNCCVISVKHPHGSTPSITDTRNTWSTADAVADAGVGNNVLSVFVLPNVAEGDTTFTVGFGAAVVPFKATFTEVYNVAISDVIAGLHTATEVAAPNLACGSFTPENNDDFGGNLILAFFGVSADATDNPTAWTPGGSFQLLDADIAGLDNNSFPSASMFLVQAEAAAINPAITATGDTGNSYNCVAIALKAAGEGTPRRAGIYVNKVIHLNSSHGSQSVAPDWPLQTPAVGNLRVLVNPTPPSYFNITSITDNDTGSTWVKKTDNQFWYSENRGAKNDLAITIHITGTPPALAACCMRFFDVSDAAASAFDVEANTVSTDCSNVSTVTDQPVIAPTTSDGLVIAALALGLGPSWDLASGAPTGAVFDSFTYDDETDIGELMDDADGIAHFYNPDTATEHWNWTIRNVDNNSKWSSAVAFKRETQLQDAAIGVGAGAATAAGIVQPAGIVDAAAGLGAGSAAATASLRELGAATGQGLAGAANTDADLREIAIAVGAGAGTAAVNGTVIKPAAAAGVGAGAAAATAILFEVGAAIGAGTSAGVARAVEQAKVQGQGVGNAVASDADLWEIAKAIGVGIGAAAAAGTVQPAGIIDAAIGTGLASASAPAAILLEVATAAASGAGAAAADGTVPQNFLPADRTFPWNPGMMSKGGIPTRTTIHETVNPRGGGLDDTANIQAAIDACPDEQVVLLAAGTFTIGDGNFVLINKGITLRGSGQGTTIIQRTDGAEYGPSGRYYGTNPTPHIIIGPSRYGPWFNPDSSANSTNLTADADAGDYTISVASTANFSAGQFVLIDEASGAGWQTDHEGFGQVWASSDYRVVFRKHNPSLGSDDFDSDDYPTNPGGGGGVSDFWCRLNRPTCEVKEIESVNAGAGTITFTTPVSISYRTSNTAQLTWLTDSGTGDPVAFVQGAGVENLSLQNGDEGNLQIKWCAYCWVLGVEASIWNGENVSLDSCYKIELRQLYNHDAAHSEPGGGAYSIVLNGGSAEVLVEDCISVRANKVSVARCSGAGCVFGYNYTDMGFINYAETWVEMGINASHTVGPHHVLFEGNYSFSAESDITHGNSIYMTFFRNHLSGFRHSFVNPNTGHTIDDINQQTTNGPLRCAGPTAYGYWFSFVGNVMGIEGEMADFVYEWSGSEDRSIWRLGHDGEPGSTKDSYVTTYAIRDGNWDWKTSSQHWHNTPGGFTIPDSMYLTSKPAFFDDYTWPWVDPSTGATYTLPAKARFDAAGAAVGTGLGSASAPTANLCEVANATGTGAGSATVAAQTGEATQWQDSAQGAGAASAVARAYVLCAGVGVGQGLAAGASTAALRAVAAASGAGESSVVLSPVQREVAKAIAAGAGLGFAEATTKGTQYGSVAAVGTGDAELAVANLWERAAAPGTGQGGSVVAATMRQLAAARATGAGAAVVSGFVGKPDAAAAAGNAMASAPAARIVAAAAAAGQAAGTVIASSRLRVAAAAIAAGEGDTVVTAKMLAFAAGFAIGQGNATAAAQLRLLAAKFHSVAFAGQIPAEMEFTGQIRPPVNWKGSLQ